MKQTETAIMVRLFFLHLSGGVTNSGKLKHLRLVRTRSASSVYQKTASLRFHLPGPIYTPALCF